MIRLPAESAGSATRRHDGRTLSDPPYWSAPLGLDRWVPGIDRAGLSEEEGPCRENVARSALRLKVEQVYPRRPCDVQGRRRRPAALHRRSLQCPTPALRPGLSEPQHVRGPIRPRPGKNRRLKLSNERGAFQRRERPWAGQGCGIAWFSQCNSHAQASEYHTYDFIV